jgi:hypothetical protein
MGAGTARLSDRAALFRREIDDLLLRARGLALVRDLLVERGASRAEIEAHTAALERVRRQLADLVGGRPPSRTGLTAG